MNIRRLALALILAICLPGMTALQAQDRVDLDRAWEGVISDWSSNMIRSGVVGSSLMLLLDGEILKTAEYGSADMETERPIDGNTIYHWASNTKMLTGIAVMQLRDLGLLSLDDPIVDYIPELKRVRNPFGGMEDIRIHHLLSHSAGFRGSTWPWSDEDWHPHEPTKWEQIVSMLPYTEIHFEPGLKYSYSNPGIIFLGRIIELLTGDDYEVYIDKNILKPLEMHRTYFDHTPRHLLSDRSNNYYVTDGEVEANGLDFDTGITVSNGGLNAPLSDIARYVAFLTGGGASQGRYEAVLARSSLEEMWEIRQPVSSADDEEWSLGLIFFIRDSATPRIVGHTGGQQGFRTFIYVQPETGSACIAAFNTIAYRRNEEGNLFLDDAAFISTRRRLFEEVFPLLK